MFRYFIIPTAVSIGALALIYVIFGTTAFLTAVLLSILEVTLSFDNAVVNAKVLKQMSEKWRKRFLTWGILFAVIGTRLVLPVLIVSVTAWISPWEIAKLALFDVGQYSHLLNGARDAINAFGGVFLLMVSLKYFIDENKTVHWIHAIEDTLSEWAKIESVEIAVGLISLAAISFAVPVETRASVLIAGIVGIVLFIVMEGVTHLFSTNVNKQAAAAAGLALFIYLNVLDSAFSLDSVVGAFALTNLIPVIVVGLGIGAYFVRSITLYLVEQDTLGSLKYLEHGAHWAIFGLAASLFIGLLVEIPEVVTGSIGLIFVLAAYYSSVLSRQRKAQR